MVPAFPANEDLSPEPDMDHFGTPARVIFSPRSGSRSFGAGSSPSTNLFEKSLSNLPRIVHTLPSQQFWGAYAPGSGPFSFLSFGIRAAVPKPKDGARLVGSTFGFVGGVYVMSDGKAGTRPLRVADSPAAWSRVSVAARRNGGWLVGGLPILNVGSLLKRIDTSTIPYCPGAGSWSPGASTSSYLMSSASPSNPLGISNRKVLLRSSSRAHTWPLPPTMYSRR